MDVGTWCAGAWWNVRDNGIWSGQKCRGGGLNLSYPLDLGSWERERERYEFNELINNFFI